MNLAMIKRCLLGVVTVILFLNTVSVEGKTTTLTATPTERTRTLYMYSLSNSDENNTVVITAQNATDLVSFRVITSDPLNQTQCDRGGNKVYSQVPRGTKYYMGTFCGGTAEERFAASHSTVVIVLDNAMANSASMKLTYIAQNYCSAFVTVGRHPWYIRTPGYPNGGIPTQFSHCVWLVTYLDDSRVRISLKFATPDYSPDWHKSNVTIWEGWTPNPIIGMWCGGPQSSFISWNRRISVQAKGLEYLESGFEMEFVAVTGERCEHKINADNVTSGVITSPGYPDGYADLLECRWEISVFQQRNIRVTVLDSDMDSSSNCTRDYVKVYAHDPVLGEALKTWCGTQKPFFEVYSGVVLLVFKVGSGYNNTYKGFKLRYDVSKEPACGGNLTALQPSQQLSTVGYPNPFRGYQQCIWYIRASNTQKFVYLSVVSSDLYIDVYCNRERVSVYDGWTVTEARRLGKWCGSTTPSYRGKSSYMMVVFTSERTNTERNGFRAIYREGMCTAKKIVQFFPSWITSPGYPADYQSGYNCFWNLTGVWSAIAVRITDLDMRCPGDNITIYDGGLSSGNRNWTVCGTGTYSYLITSLKIYIHFQTQTSLGKGFNLTYSRYGGNVLGCELYDRTLYFTTSRSVLRSPGYPGNYFDKLSCRWRLRGSTKVRLEIEVKGLGGQSENNCGGDYISVYDGFNERAPVRYAKLCRDVTIESSSSQMFVKFVTDDANTGQGFTIYYQGFVDRISTKATPRPEDGSSSPSILVMVLIPIVCIFIAVVCCLCFVKRKRSSDFNVNSSVPEDVQRRNNLSNNRNNTGAPSDTDNQRSDPYGPPPSYIELEQFPAEDKSSAEPPPPNYMDAVHGGMIQNTDQN